MSFIADKIRIRQYRDPEPGEVTTLEGERYE